MGAGWPKISRAPERSKLAVFCTTNNLGRWEAAARDSTAWPVMADDFIMSIAAS